MHLTIRPDDQVLARYGNALGQLGGRTGHKALARAVNRTTNTVHSRVVRGDRQTILDPGRDCQIPGIKANSAPRLRGRPRGSGPLDRPTTVPESL